MLPCPCCGYLVFEQPVGSYEVCPVCDWEDDGLQLEYATSLSGGANRETLVEAQSAFATRAQRLQRKHPGAAIPFARDPLWRPIDSAVDNFPRWDERESSNARPMDETLFYWRPTFRHRESAT